MEQDLDGRRRASRGGAISAGGRTFVWAAVANWDPAVGTSLDHLTVRAVLRGMRHVGEFVLDAVS